VLRRALGDAAGAGETPADSLGDRLVG
jgi:hypothetical protein